LCLRSGEVDKWVESDFPVIAFGILKVTGIATPESGLTGFD